MDAFLAMCRFSRRWLLHNRVYRRIGRAAQSRPTYMPSTAGEMRHKMAQYPIGRPWLPSADRCNRPILLSVAFMQLYAVLYINHRCARLGLAHRWLMHVVAGIQRSCGRQGSGREDAERGPAALCGTPWPAHYS